MRRRGSVRLCNAIGCHQPFPCAMHDGALALKASCERIRLNIRAGLGTDDRTYPCCGRHVCSCVKTPEPKPVTTDTDQPREGWVKDDINRRQFVRKDGRAAVGESAYGFIAWRKTERGYYGNEPETGWYQSEADTEQPHHKTIEAAMAWADSKLQAEGAAKAEPKLWRQPTIEVDALPEGWSETIVLPGEQRRYSHTNGAVVFILRQESRWSWGHLYRGYGSVPETRVGTRAEAMRLALGGKP